jgi:hypothetical protein
MHMDRRSFKQAHISAAVAVVFMVIGHLVVGKDSSDVEYQVVIWTSVVAGYTVFFWLMSREYRDHDRRG